MQVMSQTRPLLTRLSLPRLRTLGLSHQVMSYVTANAKSTGILVNCRVQPNGRQTKVTSVDDSVHITIASPAVDNKANKELLSVLQDVFGCRKTDLSLVRGMKSRDKVVEVTGIALDRARELIAAQIE